MKEQLTAECVKKSFPKLICSGVEQYDMDELHGLNYVMQDALEGGVNTSLGLDYFGKSWSYLILSLEIKLPVN